MMSHKSELSFCTCAVRRTSCVVTNYGACVRDALGGWPHVPAGPGPWEGLVLGKAAQRCFFRSRDLHTPPPGLAGRRPGDCGLTWAGLGAAGIWGGPGPWLASAMVAKTRCSVCHVV